MKMFARTWAHFISKSEVTIQLIKNMLNFEFKVLSTQPSNSSCINARLLSPYFTTKHILSAIQRFPLWLWGSLMQCFQFQISATSRNIKEQTKWRSPVVGSTHVNVKYKFVYRPLTKVQHYRKGLFDQATPKFGHTFLSKSVLLLGSLFETFMTVATAI